jgi:hypothetical protein
MDLQLYLRVFWRFRVLVAAGLLLASGLAFLSFVDVKLDGGKPSFAYRQGEQWESLATLEIASARFNAGSVVDPETRSLFRTPDQQQAPEEEADPSQFASLGYLNELTTVLMPLATSDEVFRIVRSDGGGPIRGLLQTFPVAVGDAPVPLMTFSAISASPNEAVSLARRHVRAFKAFVTRRQVADGIPARERVVVREVRQPQAAALLEGRKLTRPIIVFLTVMTIILGLCFVLENLRPRVRPLASANDTERYIEPHRRTA